ncbi:(2E,6E)-farnesyl diphosphate synthase [Utexia brackfieldae]|uniref:(2E,6E)-farnesyl diphosphate synthase n=1 Tax=Utexia brackfieldae TaxID=3074108 RepID=UPI00370D828F
MTIQIFTTEHTKYTQRIDSVLQTYLQSLIPSQLSQAMSYSLLAEGKRIRPFLVYATGEMFGVPLNELDAAAAAIEAIHAYSLIHDDLPAMDDDNLRRGRPTCHIQYGEANAILAGDALQSFAFDVLATATSLTAETKLAMIQELSKASGANGMCLGQVLDIEAEQQHADLAKLKTIHHYKTGLLIRSAIRLGMYAAGEKALAYQNILDEYATAIGLAFQVQDDILNVIGDQGKMGKPQGSDKILAKSTYPALLGLDEAKQVAQSLHQQAIDAITQLPYHSQTLQALAQFIVQREK